MDSTTVVDVKDTRTYAQRYLKLRCTCGRSLRAAVEHVGSTVRCWECHRPVPVRVPSDPGRTVRVMTLGMGEMFGAVGLAGIAAGTVLFTGALLLPLPEPVLAALILAAVVFAYGELVRRFGLAGAMGCSARSLGWRAYTIRAAVTLAVALVLTNAWEFGRTWLGFELGLFREALAVIAALAVVFPLAMLTVWAAPRPRQSLAAIARHPLATAAALMVVPIGFVVAEALVVLVTSLQGYFSLYVLSLLPGSEELAPRFGIADAGGSLVFGLPDRAHLALYLHHLAQGLTLSMELPASLLRRPQIAGLAWSVDGPERALLLMRAAHTSLVATIWLTALAIQARCLGLLARLWEWHQPFAPKAAA